MSVNDRLHKMVVDTMAEMYVRDDWDVPPIILVWLHEAATEAVRVISSAACCGMVPCRACTRAIAASNCISSCCVCAGE